MNLDKIKIFFRGKWSEKDGEWGLGESWEGKRISYSEMRCVCFVLSLRRDFKVGMMTKWVRKGKNGTNSREMERNS